MLGIRLSGRAKLLLSRIGTQDFVWGIVGENFKIRWRAARAEPRPPGTLFYQFIRVLSVFICG